MSSKKTPNILTEFGFRWLLQAFGSPNVRTDDRKKYVGGSYTKYLRVIVDRMEADAR